MQVLNMTPEQVNAVPEQERAAINQLVCSCRSHKCKCSYFLTASKIHSWQLTALGMTCVPFYLSGRLSIMYILAWSIIHKCGQLKSCLDGKERTFVSQIIGLLIEVYFEGT